MLMSLRVGTNDIAKARAFYDATFTALGENPSVGPATARVGFYKLSNGPIFMVGGTADGAPATSANGGTILFSGADDAAVDAWFAAGIANGGTSEGDPGPRAQAGGRHGAYLRDPDGNKLGCYAGTLFG